ncbi:MAG: sulfotransferase, partial [Chloroflexales bacterium]|nr:sulfotransferase [Chloroflexales bacterium]
LLVADSQFAYPTVYQASFPHTFLSTEKSFSRWADAFKPRTRMMDTMQFRFDLPQEDEFALCAATGRSPLLGQVFPRRAAFYDRYLTFSDVPAAVVETWQRALVWFLQKLTYNDRRPLVLKSPPHTARVRLLLEVFPNARFVHISRDPYAVFQSTRHMYDTMVWHTYLQAPDTTAIDGDILRRYTTMYDAYDTQRALIPPDQLHEVRYEDLARDPLGELRQIYQALGINGFERAAPRLRAYVAGLRQYQPNEHRTLPEAVRERVRRAWRQSFDRWGYNA